MLATVSASALNVRSIPNATGSIVGVLDNGSVVHIVNEVDHWAEIQFQEATGFVSRHYLETVSSSAGQLRGFIRADLLNVRDVPSAGGNVVGTLISGTKIHVLNKLSGWLEILFNQELAYVSETYVDLYRENASYIAEVTTEVLNVRQRPMAAAQVLGQVYIGGRLNIESNYGEWAEISFNDTKAFIHRDYLRVIDEPATERIVVADDGGDEDEAVIPQSANIEEPLILEPSIQLPVEGSATKKKVASTWNRYGGLLSRLSEEKDIDVGCAVAVLCVESSGKGFEPSNDNRMIIRFENHKFWKYWGKHNPEKFRECFSYSSNKVWTGHKWRKNSSATWESFHGRQSREWRVFEFARRLDSDAAMQSISMGAPQIMGFHYERIGYQSIEEMFDAFASDIGAHINGLFDFFSSSMVRKLRELDFEGFAAGYNGSGQKEKYGRWIDDHYRAFKVLHGQ